MSSAPTATCCFVPSDLLDTIRKSSAADEELREIAIDTIAASEAARMLRTTFARMPMMAAVPSPAGQKYRLVYDMEGRRFPLPGKLVLEEGGDLTGVADSAVKEAHQFAGDTYDFYRQVLNRNSLDNSGMELQSSVHYGRKLNNAYWNGQQMLYGDGDGRIFIQFTKALDVVAHELTHGVIMYECNLVYQDEPGALNESFADVMSALVKQWRAGQTTDQADWLMGDAIMAPTLTPRVRSLRTFKGEKAYENHPLLGTDLQPKRMNDKYTGPDDYGGVHINSGIPNHAFYRVATALGGNAWDTAGRIWYQTMRNLTRDSVFKDCAKMTYQVAVSSYGDDAVKAVKEGWDAVGISVL
jgi:Zn-dependent metalloprotease